MRGAPAAEWDSPLGARKRGKRCVVLGGLDATPRRAPETTASLSSSTHPRLRSGPRGLEVADSASPSTRRCGAGQPRPARGRCSGVDIARWGARVMGVRYPAQRCGPYRTPNAYYAGTGAPSLVSIRPETGQLAQSDRDCAGTGAGHRVARKRLQRQRRSNDTELQSGRYDRPNGASPKARPMPDRILSTRDRVGTLPPLIAQRAAFQLLDASSVPTARWRVG